MPMEFSFHLSLMGRWATRELENERSIRNCYFFDHAAANADNRRRLFRSSEE